MISVANQSRFESVPPARIVPILADDGVYLGSESTISRVMGANNLTAHRGRAKAPHTKRPPTNHIATVVRQVWCWNTTYLPATVVAYWFHLYLTLGLYSDKIVDWEVQELDLSDHAVQLVRRGAGSMHCLSCCEAGIAR